MKCLNCKEEMIGDGFTEPIRCPDVEMSEWFEKEPDCAPIYCEEDLS